MGVPFFDLKRQNEILRPALDSAIKGVVDSGRFILGENVAALEKELAAYCGVNFSVGVASGTDALLLALKACGVKAGDEVITSTFTFVATADAIKHCGAIPVFADIEPNTFNIDPASILKCISKKTKAIIPVHLYGLSCDMAPILEIAQKYRLKVIEDCAQAIGATHNNHKVGVLGDIGCFSFFPTKTLGCFGDGGILTTNNEELVNELRVLRGHGSRKTYHYDLVGYNSRLDELQASIIRVKLPFLDAFINSRRHNAAFYLQQLKDLSEIVMPQEPAYAKHTYNQFTIKTSDRNGLLEYLKVRGIGAMVYYPLSLHLQNCFKDLGYKPGSFPASEKSQEEVLSLPIYPELTKAELSAVCAAIKEYFQK